MKSKVFNRQRLLPTVTISVVAASLLAWIIDAAVDYFFFLNIPFCDVLLFAVPAHDLYLRLLTSLFFVIAGTVIYLLLRHVLALQEERARALEIVNSLEEAIIGVTGKFTVTVWNRGAEQMFGILSADAFGKKLDALPTGIPAETVEKIRTSSLQNEHIFGMKISLPLGNSLKIIELSISPAVDAASGGLLGASLIARDVSSVHESEIHKSQLAAIVESSDDAIASIGLDGNIISWNRGAEKMYGYKPEEIIGKPVEVLIPNEAADDAQLYKDFLKGERSVDHYETIRKKKNGEIIYTSTTYSLIKSVSGEVTAIASITRDITDQVKEEERQREQSEQLAHADKMITLGTLVAGVAHEINNPTNFLTVNAPLLQEIWAGLKPFADEKLEREGDFQLGRFSYAVIRGRIDELFRSITDGAHRIQAIVSELKDFARPSLHSLNARIDLNEVIRNSIYLLKPSISKATERFVLSLQENLPPVKGNQQRLEQVIINLVQNGCEALTDKSELLSIVTRFDKKKNLCIVEITDQGCGIDSETMTHMLDPFFTTKRSEGGSGLGLAISSRIIEDHKGTLAFDSKPGEGTKVSVYLPPF